MIRAEPIVWLVDEKANIALSKKIIFSGVQFKNKKDYEGNFEETDIKQFMDKYFVKESGIEKLISVQQELWENDNIFESILEEELNSEPDGPKLILRR